MLAIETAAVGTCYGRQWALRNCTLSIPAGRVVGLLGANGAGKSTLMNLIVGLLRPTEGRIDVLGRAPGRSAAQLARVGFLAQNIPLYDDLSVGDHLRFGKAMNPAWDGPGDRLRWDRHDRGSGRPRRGRCVRREPGGLDRRQGPLRPPVHTARRTRSHATRWRSCLGILAPADNDHDIHATPPRRRRTHRSRRSAAHRAGLSLGVIGIQLGMTTRSVTLTALGDELARRRGRGCRSSGWQTSMGFGR